MPILRYLRETCLHKLPHVLYVILPILKTQVHVPAQFIHYFLYWRIFTNQRYPFSAANIDGFPHYFHIIIDFVLFFLRIVSNQCFENFICGEGVYFLPKLPFHSLYFDEQLMIIFLHRTIKGHNRFVNLFLEILKKPFNQPRDLFLCFFHSPSDFWLIEGSFLQLFFYLFFKHC